MRKQRSSIKNLLDGASLASNGSRVQFGVAMTLTTILPLLTLAYLFYGGDSVRNLPEVALWLIAFILICMVCLGYALLVKYPITIINLRRYMESVARGELPGAVGLPDGECDITAIQEYFNLILAQMKKRIALIQEQQMALIHAERQRVMTESLCTACHHLGQPATVISCYLDLMRKEVLPLPESEYLELCIDEASKMSATLRELQEITRYRTEPYCKIPEAQEDTAPRIIQVRGDKAVQLPDETEESNDILSAGEDATRLEVVSL